MKRKERPEIPKEESLSKVKYERKRPVEERTVEKRPSEGRPSESRPSESRRSVARPTDQQQKLKEELEAAMRERHDEEVRLETRRKTRRKKRKDSATRLFWILVILLLGVIAAFSAVLVRHVLYEPTTRNSELVLNARIASGSAEDLMTEADTSEQDTAIVEEAERLAAMYDYDAAIALMKTAPGYLNNTELQDRVIEIQQEASSCVAYPIDQITHVFFHTLIYDPSLAFDGDSDEAGYNQYMTTIDEFNKIIQSMYDRGYVMVSLHDMMDVAEDGSMSRKEILLPEGKIPFVLSQDDVSYYHYMDGDGFAKRLIVDENGDIRNEYIEADGSVTVGDFDMVPLIDRFVESHPSFSYKGHKGVIALTGYDGVLGYRTDSAYLTRERLDEYQELFFQENPDFGEEEYQKECADAKVVADAMKAEGWEFASHTWGHLNATNSDAEKLKTDDERFKSTATPIIGETDIIIFAFGADIGDWRPYSMENPKFEYYKSVGYNFFCNVDASQTYWVQIGSDFLRQARRNLDGYRMYYDLIDDNVDYTSDLFDVESVFDPCRPTPVPAL